MMMHAHTHPLHPAPRHQDDKSYPVEKGSGKLGRTVLYTTSWARHRGGPTAGAKWCKDYAYTPKHLADHPGLATHVHYAFGVVNETSLEVSRDEDKELIAELQALKKGDGGDSLKTLGSLGGAAFSLFPAITADKETRKAFAKSAVKWMDARGFDGLDVDWEFPEGPEERDGFTALLSDLRAALDSAGHKDALLTAALKATSTPNAFYDVDEVEQYLDYVSLMAYDFHGGSFDPEGPANHNAPLLDCATDFIGINGARPCVGM